MITLPDTPGPYIDYIREFIPSVKHLEQSRRCLKWLLLLEAYDYALPRHIEKYGDHLWLYYQYCSSLTAKAIKPANKTIIFDDAGQIVLCNELAGSIRLQNIDAKRLLETANFAFKKPTDEITLGSKFNRLLLSPVTAFNAQFTKSPNPRLAYTNALKAAEDDEVLSEVLSGLMGCYRITDNTPERTLREIAESVVDIYNEHMRVPIKIVRPVCAAVLGDPNDIRSYYNGKNKRCILNELQCLTLVFALASDLEKSRKTGIVVSRNRLDATLSKMDAHISHPLRETAALFNVPHRNALVISEKIVHRILEEVDIHPSLRELARLVAKGDYVWNSLEQAIYYAYPNDHPGKWPMVLTSPLGGDNEVPLNKAAHVSVTYKRY